MARNWYIYAGNGSTGSYSLPGSYSLVPGATPACNEGGSLCAVYAAADTEFSPNPAFISANVRNYINLGLATFAPQPTAGTNIYVKMKPAI